MKVVIFAGGLGVRMGEATQTIPKPMIRIGTHPILWHIMKWYASWGHTEFIICLGYRAEVIKEYFLSYSEALSNDFVLTNGGSDVELLGSDTSDWRITFVDTGIHATIGERLRRVAAHIGDDEYFLATYGDGVTDAPLDTMIATLQQSRKTGLALSVRTRLEYHLLNAGSDGVVSSITSLSESNLRINGGYFVFRRDLIDVIGVGEELVEEPFVRLIERGELLAFEYDGFWEPMDTIKDKQKLDALLESGAAPWRRNLTADRVMLRVALDRSAGGIERVLAIGCHADDIEIGCGGTLLSLIRSTPQLDVTWVVLAARDVREAEATESAQAFLADARGRDVRVLGHEESFLPYRGAEVKDSFEQLKAIEPDLVLTHARDDLHQDHRLACELTWNTFRDHLILEYEIPKYDGDFGVPNVFVPLEEEFVDEKLRLLGKHFRSQSSKHWFDDELFRGLMRLRGMESATRYAEAFTCRKLSLVLA